MKSTFLCSLALLFICSKLFAQHHIDTLAELSKEHLVHTINITPDEKIIVKTSDYKFYIKNSEYSPFSCYNNTLDSTTYVLKFISKNKAIAFGEYSENDYSYLLSDDGGKSFSKHQFDSTLIIFINSDKTGNTWICGDDGTIYESTNLGISWNKIIVSACKKAEINRIAMNTINSGILCANDTSLYITDNHWKCAVKIKTPAHQFSINDSYIHEIFCWKDYYIVQQDYQYYFTKNQKLIGRNSKTNLVL